MVHFSEGRMSFEVTLKSKVYDLLLIGLIKPLREFEVYLIHP